MSLNEDQITDLFDAVQNYDYPAQLYISIETNQFFMKRCESLKVVVFDLSDEYTCLMIDKILCKGIVLVDENDVP